MMVRFCGFHEDRTILAFLGMSEIINMTEKGRESFSLQGPQSNKTTFKANVGVHMWPSQSSGLERNVMGLLAVMTVRVVHSQDDCKLPWLCQTEVKIQELHL